MDIRTYTLLKITKKEKEMTAKQLKATFPRNILP